MRQRVRRTARRSWRRCPSPPSRFGTAACCCGTGLNADFALPAADVAARAPLPASLAAAGAMRAPAATAPPTPVAAAPTATAVPAAPIAAPAIAPAPSWGAPDTRPVAMPGPKIPSASKVSEASMMTSAWSIEGSSGWTWNCAKRPEPIPTITARTSTLTPADTTLPSTFSARNEVLFHSANGTSTKPASVVNLNSISVMKSWIASTKKHSTTTSHARNSTKMASRFKNTSGNPIRSSSCRKIGPPASRPAFASRPGCKKSSIVIVEPVAVIPSPANERNTMLASQLKLLMM